MTICCAGSLVDLTVPRVMGVLNLTTDSFYDGGKYVHKSDMLQQVERMLEEGSDFVDIGGHSTRPGAKIIPLEEELRRVIGSIELISKYFPQARMAIDTFRSEVARVAVEAGVVMVNDVSGGTLDENMFEIVAQLRVPYILGHIQGRPEDMQDAPYYDNIIIEINRFFSEKIARLRALGVDDIILDPGFGFGKTVKHNFQMVKHLSLIGFGVHPVLIGLSRKSTLQKFLDISTIEALNATSVMHTLTLLQGANLLRVHDVKEALECIKLVNEYKSSY
ncbi:MAG: dihydropteroate synthase [Flavobacteriales bacterium AspAUS03]